LSWKVSVLTWAFEAARPGFGPVQTRGTRMTTEEATRQIAEMGFDAFEFVIWNMDDFPKSRRQKIKEEIESLNLEMVNICCNDNVYVWSGPVYTSPDEKVRAGIVKRIKQEIEAAVEWDCKCIGIWPGSDVIPFKIPYWEAWKYLVDTISRCAKIAEDHGVLIALEYKPENVLNNVDSTLRILKEVNSEKVGALLDTGHAIVAREHLPTVVEMLNGKLFHIHVDDNYGDWDRDMPPGTVHDFKPFLEALKRIGYKGSLSMDIWPYEDPYKEIKMGKDYLENLMREIQ